MERAQKRAVVLGGGGSVGAAWQTALIAAWQLAGVDLAVADLIVGTSAGASVGVQVALGQDLEQRRHRAGNVGQQPATRDEDSIAFAEPRPAV